MAAAPSTKIAHSLRWSATTIGGVLILSSFLTQTLLFDRLDAQQREDLERTRYVRDFQSEAHSKRILALVTASEEDRRQMFKEAAVAVWSAEARVQDFQADILNRLGEAAAVDSNEAFLRFEAGLAATRPAFDVETMANRMVSLSRTRDYYRAGYLVLYVLGTVLILMGERRERDRQPT